jgi:hypothetical protein
MVPKLVTTTHYHLWTDALHARALASQAKNKWDRGTYVRWTVTTAWTVFEMCSADALQIKKWQRGFKDTVNARLTELGLGPLDWGQGLWGRVLDVYAKRKEYVHLNSSPNKLFPDVIEADTSIQVLREAIKAIYNHAHKAPPVWVDDDLDRGWDEAERSSFHAQCVHAGVDESDPDVIRLGYVHKDREYITDIYPPRTDPEPGIQQLLQSIRIPISAIRVYRGSALLEERPLNMRGI